MASADLGNFVSVEYTASAGSTAPATAYANWAAELGVSATASLYTLDSDDGAWLVTLAESPMVNSPLVSGMVSSEGGIGLYKKSPANTTTVTVTTIPNISRMCFVTDRPDVLFTFHPQVDLKSVGVKLQRSGSTTIIGGRVQQYQSSTSAPVNVADFAMRLNGSASIVLIVSAPAGDTPVPLYVMDGTVNLSGALMDTVAAGTTRQITAVVTNNAGNLLSAARLDDLKTASSLAWTGTPVAFRLIGEGRVSRRNHLFDLTEVKGRVRGFTLDYVNPLNKPYSCRVRLVREVDGLIVRELWSKPDGSYDFQYVDELQSYTVIAYYEAHGKRAVVTDGLTLANGKVELMA